MYLTSPHEVYDVPAEFELIPCVVNKCERFVFVSEKTNSKTELEALKQKVLQPYPVSPITGNTQ